MIDKKLDVEANTETKEEVHSRIKSALNKLGDKCTKEQKKEFAKVYVNIFEKGMLPKEAAGFSDNDILGMNIYASHQFAAGKYEEAKSMFKALLYLDPDSTYMTSLGVCCQKLKQYREALMYYYAALTIDVNDPIPCFYSYGCYMALNNKVFAAIFLANTIKRAGDHPKYAVMKREAERYLKNLKDEVVPKEA